MKDLWRYLKAYIPKKNLQLKNHENPKHAVFLCFFPGGFSGFIWFYKKTTENQLNLPSLWEVMEPALFSAEHDVFSGLPIFGSSRFWPGAAQNAGQTEHPPSKDATKWRKWRNRIEVDFFLKGLRISKSSNQIARAECLFWHLLILLLLCCVILCVMSLLSYTVFLCILPHSISVYDILFYHSILHDIIWYLTLYWTIILHCIVFNDIIFYYSTLYYIFIIILYNIILYIYSNTLHYYTIHVMILYIYIYMCMLILHILII